MNKIKNLITYAISKPVVSLLVFIAFGCCIIVIVQLPYYVGRFWGIPTDFTASDLLQFWGSYLSFVGTIFLGAIAYNQNKGLSKLNTKLMSIQNQAYAPALELSNVEINFKHELRSPHPNADSAILAGPIQKIKRDNGKQVNYYQLHVEHIEYLCRKTRGITAMLHLKNISEAMIIGVRLVDISVKINGSNIKSATVYPVSEKSPDIVELITHNETLQIMLFFRSNFYRSKEDVWRAHVDFVLNLEIKTLAGKYYETIKFYTHENYGYSESYQLKDASIE